MPQYRSVQAKRVLVGRLEYGGDLLEQLTSVCEKEGIRLGRLEAIGAVQKARISFYDQQKHCFEYLQIDKPLEIAALSGNLSLRDGRTALHVHATLAGADGTIYGGHLAEGTIVFVCEFVIDGYEGPEFNRTLDEQTGLPLWKL